MATVMLMEWHGVTEDQYRRVMETLDLDRNAAEGGLLHVAGFESGRLRVLDVWVSQQAFEKFAQARLMPAVQKVGIPGEPQVTFYPLSNLYTPNIEEIRKRGASSLPG